MYIFNCVAFAWKERFKCCWFHEVSVRPSTVLFNPFTLFDNKPSSKIYFFLDFIAVVPDEAFLANVVKSATSSSLLLLSSSSSSPPFRPPLRAAAFFSMANRNCTRCFAFCTAIESLVFSLSSNASSSSNSPMISLIAPSSRLVNFLSCTIKGRE